MNKLFSFKINDENSDLEINLYFNMEVLDLVMSGEIRITKNEKDLITSFLQELLIFKTKNNVKDITIDFINFSLCNSNGLFILMEFFDFVNKHFQKIIIKRNKNYPWQFKILTMVINSLIKTYSVIEFKDFN